MDFENVFKNVYAEAVGELQPSSELMERILKKEEKKVMKINKKKVVIVAVAACMLLGTTALAAGKIAGYRSWANPQDAVTDYTKAEEAAENYGIGVNMPETFANGYAFAEAVVGGVDAVDEAGDTMDSGNSFMAIYKKAGCPDIYLNVDPVFEASENPYKVDSKKIGGTEVSVDQAVYKFVPPSYEMTEADEARMDDPHFELSYGSDKVCEQTYAGVGFEKDGKYYAMFAWDSEMTAEEWYSMAEEMLAE